jgi:ABC-type antimicrobial peptide transport system permease subunit
VTPGTDVQDVYRRVEAAPPLPTEAYGLRDFAAAEVPSLASLRWVPLWLAACLVLVVLVTVTFALALAVRRRLRDLAVLRVLGARRRALRFAGLSQGLTVASCAVVVGVPLGVVIGRWSWIWLGAREGIPAEPVVPLGQVLAFVVVLSLLVGLAGGLAVLLGLRRPTTVVLRDE